MPAYPIAFSHDRFPRVPDAVKPTAPKKSTTSVKSSPQMGGSLRIGPTNAQVDAIWLQEVGGDRQSISSDNHSDQKYADANDPIRLRDEADDTFLHFYFAPGIDAVEIRWQVQNLQNVSKARFELWTAADNTAPIWTLEKQDDEARRLLRGPMSQGSGPLAWNQVTIPVDARFPDGCPNAANAPYQLRLTLTCSETKAVTTAWTYFDILVDGIELHWGPPAWIPAAAINNVSAMLRARTTADELTLLRRLKGQVQPMDPEVTPVATGGTIPVRLSSTMAAYAHFNEWFGFGKDFAYLRHKARWGDGPRIPIRAQIYLKRMDGARLDPALGHCTADQAGAALGPIRLMWDWHDRAILDRTADERRRWPEAGDFVLTALDYQLNTGQEPPGCRNCHFERGGKRAGPDRIFPAQPGTAELPFLVTACANRQWAALSTAKTSGPNACSTGVLFQPSRMAKDTYRISVLLANQLTNDLVGPAVDEARTISAVLNSHPGLPNARTGMIEIIRQINARYIRKTNYTPVNLVLIDQSYEVAGLYIEWLNTIDPTFTGFWLKADYDNYMNQAIGMGGALFSDQQIMGHRYSGAVQNKVRENRYAVIAGMVNWNLLNQYDHWWGTTAGQVAPNPSETCFTFPARDVVVPPYLDQAIQNYINKPRRINGILRRWNRFLAANGPVATAALRLQFYNGLNAAKKLKVDNIASGLYTADGWQIYNQLDPNQWVLSNYLHMNGPIDLLAEMHQLKIANDGYEGVSFFHYINVLETLDATGNPVAPIIGADPAGRYYGLSGLAKCDTGVDLGLKSVFFLWDHPNAPYRGNALGEAMMDGNTIAVHEFGHNMHLTHPFGNDGAWNRDMHDKNPAERPQQGQASGPADQCVMNYHAQDCELCGACRLRLRGWAMFRVPPLQGFDVTNPDQPGRALRPSGVPLYNTFFADLG